MPGIEVVRDGVVFSTPVLILVFIFIIVFVTMVNGHGTHHFYFNTQVRLRSAAVDSGVLGGCAYAQERGEKRAPDFERLHAGEIANKHAHNLPSTLIAADGTALCLKLKNLGSETNDVAQKE